MEPFAKHDASEKEANKEQTQLALSATTFTRIRLSLGSGQGGQQVCAKVRG